MVLKEREASVFVHLHSAHTRKRSEERKTSLKKKEENSAVTMKMCAAAAAVIVDNNQKKRRNKQTNRSKKKKKNMGALMSLHMMIIFEYSMRALIMFVYFHIAYFCVHCRAVALYFSLSVL